MIKKFLGVAFLIIGLLIFARNLVPGLGKNNPVVPVWQYRSIDTVKYSRDLSREKINNPDFDLVINKQVGDIAKTDASHIAIATPYDDEFVPMLKRWVQAARKYKLKVWFRGNFSGWEGWFGYDKISRAAHLQKTQNFILENQELFEDGDIFTSCPECENGGPGDPRRDGDTQGFREFLTDEYQVSQNSFQKINKKVTAGFYSMNYDVANLIMDKDTTQALGGIVVIDHYVKQPEELDEDVTKIAKKSNGKVVLGEFGVPIPDINGVMTEQEQSDWVNKALSKLSQNSSLVGLNYWVNVGGTTQLWTKDDKTFEVVKTLTKFYNLKKSLP